MTICIEWENKKIWRWIKWTHTFFFGAIRAEFYDLFVFMTFYWWHRQLLRMKLLGKNVSPDGKSHTWKIIKRFQLIGCMNQLPCCQLIGISFLHNEIHFFTISSSMHAPLSIPSWFYVNAASMHCHCLSCFCCCWCCCLCAFALLIMTCNFFFVLAFFNYLAQSVGLSIIFQCVFKYLGFSVDTSINKWYSFGVSHSQMHFSIARCSKSIGTKQNNLLLKLHVFIIFLPLGKSDWSQLWRRQYN